MIKKIVLGLFVVAIFAMYAIHQRSQSSESLQRLTSGNGTPTPSVPSNTATTNSPASTTPAAYKDGSYTGTSSDAFYGNIQVQAIISGGKLTDVTFLQYPNDRQNSIMINQYAMPILKSQAIAAQSSNVDGVSGATDSSQAFVQSLDSALAQAKAS